MSRSVRMRRESLFSVYVGNLHPDITKDDILNLFCKCGTIKDSVIMSPKKSHATRFGFVRYERKEEAIQAIKELNGWCVKSQRIIVDIGHDTFVKIKNSEPKQNMPIATVPNAGVLLPVVSHIDSIKNMVRVKEACVRMNSEAFSHLGIVKVSRINTYLAHNQYSDIAHTSQPLKPRSVIGHGDPMLSAFRKLSKETATSSSSGPEVSNMCSKKRAMDILCKLLGITQLSHSPEKHKCLCRMALDPASQKNNHDRQQPEKSKTSLHQQALPVVNHTAADAHRTCKPKDNCFGLPLSKDPTRTTLYSQNSSSRNERSQAYSSHEFSDEISTIKPGGDETGGLVTQHRRTNVVDLKEVKENKQCDVTSSCSTSSMLCDLSGVSWLPPSLHNSRLARLTGKTLRPAVRPAMRVPFSSPLNCVHRYNSEGTSSLDSSSSLSS